VHDRALPGVAAERVLAVEASPGFIVFAGVRDAFGPRPDLVLSGINRGPNTGTAVLHSGTVGATLTGVTQGVPGLAVSLAGPDPQAWDTAEEAARRALGWLLEHPVGAAAVNVNVPDVPPEELRGLRPARLAHFGAVQADVGEVGEGFVNDLQRGRRGPGARQRRRPAAAGLGDGDRAVRALRGPRRRPAGTGRRLTGTARCRSACCRLRGGGVAWRPSPGRSLDSARTASLGAS
jgi:hypothetical protein